MSKRIRILTSEDVAAHSTAESCWVTRNGKVYDVTNFLADHPGGDDLILNYAGKDVEEIMRDPLEHDHSDSAYDMLDECFIGRLGTPEMIVSEDWVPDEDFHPEDTDVAADFEKNEFLDLRKPLFLQVWQANWSKSYYLQQSPRLFGPGYLEVFTRTSWYVVPMVWLPIAGYMFVRSLVQYTLGGNSLPLFTQNPAAPLKVFMAIHIPTSAVVKTTMCFFLGNFVWTILEYVFHRFLFHIDKLLPDNPAGITLHFLTHGIHHYLPMDRLRLVMPPVLFSVLSFPMTQLAHALFPPAMANGVIAGAFVFYVLYDCMHYALHHTKLPTYVREMKKYHLAHHYKNFELGFGVTSKMWDYVFNTVLPM
ncbi:oxidoreductase [Fomitopsis serialis]|uniref:oxidoreductase n=1 Tax=Fomitopsis serialis TaxID=139415 RepID=UPI0020083A26|nr:oxidoreductase [Neoantrodia serialis]KAH9926748.1 oxidoreductase [Neoantrodia serialis]